MKQRELEAERIPPADPIASRWLLESRKRGKIERSLIVSGFCSLVSWSRAIEGRKLLSSENTLAHLSWSPNPRTFQDTIENDSFS